LLHNDARKKEGLEGRRKEKRKDKRKRFLKEWQK
jgi:hypothetical protein